jgi:hypothetical protein
MRALATLLPMLLFATCALAEAQVPEDALRRFYAWVLAHPSRALPSAQERAQLAKTVSAELIQLLEAASDIEARCIEAAPKGEKPLIIEGDLFVGNYEGATEVAYGEPRRDGDLVVIESSLLYVDKRFPKAHKHRAVAWKDRVELRLAGGRWYVQDVRYSGNRSLVAELKAYIDEGTRSCAKPAVVPAHARQVIQQIQVASTKGDFAALRQLMVADFQWSFGGDSDAEQALEAWKTEAKYLRNLRRVSAQQCALRTPETIECPAKSGTGFRAGFKKTPAGWRMHYFVEGD